MLSRFVIVDNGGVAQKELYFLCNRCGDEMWEGWPRIHLDQNQDYCFECAFILGHISEAEFLSTCYHGEKIHAYVENEEIKYWWGEIPPWEKPDRRRNSPEYSEWRLDVFTRDKFTCQKCGQAEGDLEAHHIKAYHLFPELRTDLGNGITYCKPCHKLEPRQRAL